MIQKLEKLEENNPKEYWDLVNELREKKHNETDFDAESFTAFFERLYSLSNQNKQIEDYLNEHLEVTSPSNITEPDFVMEELIKAIRLLKNNKSAGPDRIIAEMLKATPEPR